MFSDNMVLQRGKPDPIWGWAKPGDVIKVEIAGRTAKAVADASGRWQAEIEPPAPGGPYTIKITGPDQTVELHEVLVGDVWPIAHWPRPIAKKFPIKARPILQ